MFSWCLLSFLNRILKKKQCDRVRWTKKVGNFTRRMVNDGQQSEIYACACIEVIANREKKHRTNV